MPDTDLSEIALRFEERNHVEKPMLHQLKRLDLEIVDLTKKKRTSAARHPECVGKDWKASLLEQVATN